MKNCRLIAFAFCLFLDIALPNTFGQGVAPYPNAITDRVVRKETPKRAPRVNKVFRDPDFGSLMVRATDETTYSRHPNGYFRSPAVGEKNTWSADNKKFYFIGDGNALAFAFDPSTMKISSLPGATAGQPLVLPLGPSPMFSFVDPDLAYGTSNTKPFTISEYRFSTNTATPLIDTTTCGLQPSLDTTNRLVRTNEDVSLSSNDKRVAFSEGGSEEGNHMFVVVYDKNLGCRWYNTQTGQIGGQWGVSGYATAPAFLIATARLSGDGKYVKVYSYGFGEYFWDLETLRVTPCELHTDLHCGGYSALGHSSYINPFGGIDEMNIVKRPLDNLSAISPPLVWPLPEPHEWEQSKHFAWVNGDVDDNRPVCASIYSYDGDREITREWDDEVVCIETDGMASTVWRFAHHRAYMVSRFFNTQPLGNISKDGRFFLFTSGWDGQLGLTPDGTPRTDMWIVKLE